MPWARNLPVSVNVRRCLHFRTTNIWSQCYGFPTTSRRFQYNYFCVWILWLGTVIDSHPLNSQQEIRYLLFKLIHFAFKMERNFWHNVTYPRNYQHNQKRVIFEFRKKADRNYYFRPIWRSLKIFHLLENIIVTS